MEIVILYKIRFLLSIFSSKLRFLSNSEFVDIIFYVVYGILQMKFHVSDDIIALCIIALCMNIPEITPFSSPFCSSILALHYSFYYGRMQ